jgi:hypothetical protein
MNCTEKSMSILIKKCNKDALSFERKTPSETNIVLSDKCYIFFGMENRANEKPDKELVIPLK